MDLTVYLDSYVQRFLVENGLKLILRSHEGPDARFERDDMAGMQDGWTLDHQTPAGNLLTVFRYLTQPRVKEEGGLEQGLLEFFHAKQRLEGNSGIKSIQQDRLAYWLP